MPSDDAFDIDFSSGAQPTVQPAGSNQWDAHATAAEGGAYGRGGAGAFGYDTPAEPGDFAPSLDDAEQLDDAELAEDIDQEVAAELAAPDEEDLPFDPADAREFDRGVSQAYETPEQQVQTAVGYEDVSDDPLAVQGSYDPYGTATGAPYVDPTASGPAAPAGEVETAGEGHPRAESLVEDDLEEVDFYVGQAMYGEASDALRALFDRYPDHPLLLAKMREIEALEGGVEPAALETPPTGRETPVGSPVEMTGTDALSLDEIEEVSADDLDLEESDAPRPAAKRKPTVMLQKPVEENDADTHYDLGLAYKEMGLHDEAIKAFEKVLRSPGREVQCRVMIGMCYREQGQLNESVTQFKEGLHANATERERLSLYYELGITYEAMGDNGEALYYFEAVTKRDSNFADAAQRAEALRERGDEPSRRDDDDL
jgi:tetratricopeptide (TPR) repeat protein